MDKRKVADDSNTKEGQEKVTQKSDSENIGLPDDLIELVDDSDAEEQADECIQQSEENQGIATHCDWLDDHSNTETNQGSAASLPTSNTEKNQAIAAVSTMQGDNRAGPVFGRRACVPG